MKVVLPTYSSPKYLAAEASSLGLCSTKSTWAKRDSKKFFATRPIPAPQSAALFSSKPGLIFVNAVRNAFDPLTSSGVKAPYLYR